MRLSACVSTTLTAVLSLALCLTARADSDDHRAREAGPEDGILCCNGLIPFLFDLVAVEQERYQAVAAEDAVLRSRLARAVIVAVGPRRQAERERENGCESCRNARTQSHWIPPGLDLRHHRTLL